MIVVWLALIAVSAWHLVAGWRTGTMSAVGQVYATADSAKQPMRFWLFGGFNVLLLFGGVALMIDELSS